MSSDRVRTARNPEGMNLQPPTNAESTKTSDGSRTSLNGRVISSGATPLSSRASAIPKSAAET